MTTQLDPEENEVEALRAVGSWTGKRVLELGCGDGRLVARLASLSPAVTGIDTGIGGVVAARSTGCRRLVVADGRRLPFRAGAFDRAVFGWSL